MPWEICDVCAQVTPITFLGLIQKKWLVRKVLASDSPSVLLGGFVATCCSVSCKVLRAEHCLRPSQVKVGDRAPEVQGHWSSLLPFMPFRHLPKASSHGWANSRQGICLC